MRHPKDFDYRIFIFYSTDDLTGLNEKNNVLFVVEFFLADEKM